MVSTNPKARSYFIRLLNKAGDVTPRRENVVNPVVEVETVEPVSRVEAAKPTKYAHLASPSKKSKKRDRSSKRSHSSSRRHHHAEGGSNEPLPEAIFGASTKYANFVQTSFSESSYNMLKATDAASLVDSIIELSSRTLLIGKMMKAKNGNCVSLAEFEKLKSELAETNEKMSSLTLQLEEMNMQKNQQEIEKGNLVKHISELKAENLKIDEDNICLRSENQLLDEKILELSAVTESNTSTITVMKKEIEQLKVNVFEDENFILEQHKLGFDKALLQAKYFYKIPIDEGNFDVKKDFYKGEFIPVSEIPEEDAEDVNVVN